MSNLPAETNEPLSLSRVIEIIIPLVLIVLLMIWCFNIIAPFITPIVWGVVIAIGCYPIFLWFIKKTNLGNGLGATLFTLLMLVSLITPTLMLSSLMFDDAQALAKNLQSETLSIPAPPEAVGNLPLIGKKMEAFWISASEDPRATLGQLEPQLKSFGKWIIHAATGAGLTVLMFVFSIIIAGIFIAKADSCNKAARVIFNRIAGERGDVMTELSHKIVQSVIRGILGIAIIQSILAGLGFIAVGIPGAGFLAVICLVTAIVQLPLILVLLPIAIYGFSILGTGAAVAFLIFNLVVGLLDNVLKPILLGRGVDAPMLVVFLGAIGGMILSGILGLFIGPVILVLGYTLFVEWLDSGSKSADSN